jgi:hypothetical protein
MMSDLDAIDVPAQNGVVPNARVIAERDVADDDTASGDIDPFSEGGLSSEETVQLFIEICHGR